MSGRLAGKIALVTGAAGGIGAAVVTLFRAEGAHVFDSDRAGCAIGCDVSDRAQVDAMIASIVGETNRLNVLVHAAALTGGTGAFLDVGTADWHRYIGVNLNGTFHVCQAAAQAMAHGGGGAIVTIGSVNSFAAEPGAAAYVASKHGVLGLTRAMAVELAAYKIRVNMAAPGPINVPRNAELFASPALQTMFARTVPMRHAGQATDVAHAALYLAEDTSGFVTGSVVTVDGGALAQIMRVDEA
jgi:NAD(P)-dependent dehydrogenase (short-subunit alcohol dehydrogenase family)